MGKRKSINTSNILKPLALLLAFFVVGYMSHSYNIAKEQLNEQIQQEST